jgi:hypothetical protein
MSASQRLSLPIARLLVSGLLLLGTRAGAEEEINKGRCPRQPDTACACKCHLRRHARMPRPEGRE